MNKIRIGISACLLGQNVRYDGGHQRHRWLTDVLGRFVDWVPVCPEAECGLGVPREAMRLVGDPAAPRLVTVRTGRDLTARLRAWIRPALKRLAGEDLCGFVFKTRSPSSGLRDAKLYDERGRPGRRVPGLFAGEFVRRFPSLPVEDEGRLNDEGLRENFIERVFVQARWLDLLAAGGTRGGLVAFHTAHKLLLLAHSPPHYRELGRLVAKAKEYPPAELRRRYHAGLMAGLKLIATARKNTNVLQHAAGYFKRALDAGDKAELAAVIESYRQEQVPLVVPLTLIGHHIRKRGQPYLSGQVYFHPHPAELKLRNHC